ncbi:Unknown protein [Striga hermonthica]|uniref:ATP-dependent DNA helicase n=1 Tax=Striga hermonthica TaxID=68872 RepID=A0A9N7P3P0_STRHE|nr:Unknown protein [Striga hermonthica]
MCIDQECVLCRSANLRSNGLPVAPSTGLPSEQTSGFPPMPFVPNVRLVNDRGLSTGQNHSSRRGRASGRGYRDGRHMLLNLPMVAATLRSRSDCLHCGTLRLQFETPKFCCAEVDGEGSEESSHRDIRVSSVAGGSHSIQYYYGCYDPLQYPLLFPFGQVGWHQGIEKIGVAAPARPNQRCSSVRSVVPAGAIDADDLLFREETARIDSKQKGAFFIDGPGGTGKSFLYRALLATIRSRGNIALATATSGIAASILPGGRTAHSRFKIPIDLSALKTCRISKQSSLGCLVRESKLIVWDEAPMAKREAIEALDDALQDLCGSDAIFGGKVVVFGGDFRQVLPVIRRGNRKDTIAACITSSDLWPCLEKLRLVENMRARLDPLYTAFLLRVGNGEEKTFDDELIKIPESLALDDPLHESSLDGLINTVYPDIMNACASNLTVNRAILTTKNVFVDELNRKLIATFPGELVEYLSFDKVVNPAHDAEYGDLINSLTPSGLPEHSLQLKVNAPATSSITLAIPLGQTLDLARKNMCLLRLKDTTITRDGYDFVDDNPLLRGLSTASDFAPHASRVNQ